MAYKRILTIQDISCVGQCSMTVALPILSACGHETCILPTAMLSTHTGGFGKPSVIQLADAMDGMWRHWKACGIVFDAILIGYLGSVAAVHAAAQILDELLAPEGISIVDPAMADNGKLYAGFDESYVQAMMRLCQKADIILPNVTEAAMLSGKPYRQNFDKNYVNFLLDSLEHNCVVLTGASYRPGETGVAVRQAGEYNSYFHPCIDKSFHGTGDIFAACFTGALMQGNGISEAVQISADFTLRCIQLTCENPAHWYGMKFEAALPELIARLQK